MAVASIFFTVQRYKIALNNNINLAASKDPNQWLNREHFVKLGYTEHNRPGEQVRRQILKSIEGTLNQFELDEYAGL